MTFRFCLLLLLYICLLLSSVSELRSEILAQNTSEIRSALESGEDVALVKGKVYEVNEPILFKKDGQKLCTKDATRISEYAILRVTKPEGAQLLSGNAKSNIIVEKLVFDGNRYNLPQHNDGTPGPELTWFGGAPSQNQTIRNCVFMNTRTWSSCKLHEGGKGIVLKNCIFLGCGADSRGNGRSCDEIPPKWGDGISCAAEGSLVSDNIIIDPTDVGIVVFGAPKTEVKNNVIAALSRESLGGIVMVDGIGFFELNKGKIPPEDKDSVRKYDYRGVKVCGNLIDSRGARIHIAFPMGANIWVPRDKTTQIFVGAKVLNNTLDGDASAYGFIVDGVEDFEVSGNESFGKVSGFGDGRLDVLCDGPSPFIYNPQHLYNTKLQAEFKAVERSLQHLLRCHYGPLQTVGEFKGYKAYSYGGAEAGAVVGFAFLEMLGRMPSAKEFDFYSKLLNERSMPADQLRWILMDSEEFKSKNGGVSRGQMHNFRTQKWLRIFDEIIASDTDWSAKEVYGKALRSLSLK